MPANISLLCSFPRSLRSGPLVSREREHRQHTDAGAEIYLLFSANYYVRTCASARAPRARHPNHLGQKKSFYTWANGKSALISSVNIGVSWSIAPVREMEHSGEWLGTPAISRREQAIWKHLERSEIFSWFRFRKRASRTVRKRFQLFSRGKLCSQEKSQNWAVDTSIELRCDTLLFRSLKDLFLASPCFPYLCCECLMHSKEVWN